MMDILSDKPILLFDGECTLCNKAVQLIIRHDKQAQFMFAPLNSSIGKSITSMAKNTPDSIHLFCRGTIYTKSNAVIKLMQLLGGYWRLGIVLKVIPEVIRDKVYDLIAAHRYKWFGKKNYCMQPTEELKARFL